MEKKTVDRVIGAIKKKRSEVISFISKYGGTVKRKDSDVKIGKELVRIISSNKKANDDFNSHFIQSDNAFGIDDAIAGVSNLLSSGTQKNISAQQGQDAITLALINAGTARENKTNWPLILGIVAGIVVLLIIGIVIYKKKKI